MPMSQHRRLRISLNDTLLRNAVIVAALALGACAKAPDATPVAAVAEPTASEPAVPPAAESAPTPEAAPAPVAVAEPAPAPVKPRPTQTVSKPKPRPVSTSTASNPPIMAAAPAPVCTNCGVITDIKTVKVAGKGTGLGAVAGGVAGVIVGNQIGDGDGKTIAKIAGAAGGAYLGNRIEKRARAQDNYEVTVRLEDGSLTTVTQATDPGLSVGAAVRVVDGTVIAR